MSNTRAERLLAPHTLHEKPQKNVVRMWYTQDERPTAQPDFDRCHRR